jgi:hypothetical protein
MDLSDSGDGNIRIKGRRTSRKMKEKKRRGYSRRRKRINFV